MSVEEYSETVGELHFELSEHVDNVPQGAERDGTGTALLRNSPSNSLSMSSCTAHLARTLRLTHQIPSHCCKSPLTSPVVALHIRPVPHVDNVPQGAEGAGQAPPCRGTPLRILRDKRWRESTCLQNCQNKCIVELPGTERL